MFYEPLDSPPLPDMKFKKKEKKNVEFETVGVELVDDWLYQQSHTFCYLNIFFLKKINTILFVSLCLRVCCAFFVFRNVFKRGE